MASQRAVLLGKLIAAQSSLERVIAELAVSNVSTAAADSQLARLAGLQASLGTASAASLQTLSSEISAAIAQSRSVEQQAKDQVAAANAANSVSLGQATTASRAALNDAMDSLKHMPLNFSSPEDEQTYRNREKERSQYIASQQAKHTPQGDLNAAGAGVGQMVDAKAHGASGPEFDQKWNALTSTTEKLRAEAKANGLSTEEFDQRLRDDLRRIMKSKGYSDAQIDAQFASNADPLQAAKAFVNDSGSVDNLKSTIGMERVESSNSVSGRLSPQAQADAKDLIASLKATGVVASDPAPTAPPHHGVAVAVAQTATDVRTV